MKEKVEPRERWSLRLNLQEAKSWSSWNSDGESFSQWRVMVVGLISLFLIQRVNHGETGIGDSSSSSGMRLRSNSQSLINSSQESCD